LFSMIGVTAFTGGKTGAVRIEIFSGETGVIAEEEFIFLGKNGEISLTGTNTRAILVKIFSISARIITEFEFIGGVFSANKESRLAV